MGGGDVFHSIADRSGSPSGPADSGGQNSKRDRSLSSDDRDISDQLAYPSPSKKGRVHSSLEGVTDKSVPSVTSRVPVLGGIINYIFNDN